MRIGPPCSESGCERGVKPVNGKKLEIKEIGVCEAKKCAPSK
jgi:hypothetical protein